MKYRNEIETLTLLGVIAVEKELCSLTERAISLVSQKTGLKRNLIAPYVLSELKKTESYLLLEETRTTLERFEKIASKKNMVWLRKNRRMHQIYKNLRENAGEVRL